MSRRLLAVALMTALGTTAVAADIPTRFGGLAIGGELGSVLSFRGRRVVRGLNPLSLVRTFRMGAQDVVLIQETGGTGCPALYYFVRVSASGARATPQFGTCRELTGLVRRGGAIRVSMPGFLGPFEPPAAQARAARERHVFTYRAGMLTEHGRPVR